MILRVPPGAALFLVLTILHAPAPARGENARQGVARGPLDGMTFVGRIGPVDNQDRDDVLYFDKGQFWSSACVKCGFIPGVYWVRDVDDGIEFRGVLESRERGRFSYLGFVRDRRITVTINWRRERWYWSSDRDMQFEGTSSQAADIGMTLKAARTAASGEPPDLSDCPL